MSLPKINNNISIDKNEKSERCDRIDRKSARQSSINNINPIIPAITVANTVISTTIEKENIVANQLNKDYTNYTNILNEMDNSYEFNFKQHLNLYLKYFLEGIDIAYNMLNVGSSLNSNFILYIILSNKLIRILLSR